MLLVKVIQFLLEPLDLFLELDRFIAGLCLQQISLVCFLLALAGLSDTLVQFLAQNVVLGLQLRY